MGDHCAFFYGTLMAREILYRVCYGPNQVGKDPVATMLAENLSIRPAILHNYCRHRVRDCDYPGIIPEKGQSVRGTYVTGLTDGDMYRLDTFEGSEYSKQKVKVEVLEDDSHSSGQEMEANTYVFTAGDDLLEKIEWNYDEFRAEKLHRWTGESYEYHAALHDPTGGRSILAGGDDELKEEALLIGTKERI